jgi:8-oxo-dGTP diphosphatase
MEVVNRRVVCAVLKDCEGRILLGYRDSARQGVYPGCWHIPGGGIENGETELDALVRELKEEIGLTIDPSAARFVDGEGRARVERRKEGQMPVLCDMQFLVYQIDFSVPGREIILEVGDEFSKVRWFTRDELKTIPLVPAGPPLFERLKVYE